MIDPVHLVVLDGECDVFEDGYGIQPAHRVAVTDYYGDFEFPGSEVYSTAIKAHGANGIVYIRESDINYIVDLSDDEFRPVGEESA